jgi:hypothetical protein
MFTDDIHDHMAEHAAEKAAAEARAQAERDAEIEANQQRFREQQEQELRARQRRERPLYEAIARAIDSNTMLEADCKAARAVLDDDSNKLAIIVRGLHVDVSYRISVGAEHDRSSGRSKPTGRYRLVVGDYRDRTSYPPRRDDSYNWEAIATKLIGYAARTAAQMRQRQVKEGNVDSVVQFQRQTGLESYGTMQVQPSAVAEKPIHVKIEFSRAMSYGEAEAVYAALKSCGLIK